MEKIVVEFNDLEVSALTEYAKQAGIPIEEAIRRCVRYVLMELSPEIRAQVRADMFWEHYRHLNRILNGGKSG